MSIQRQNHKRGLLSEDHKARLDKLGFVWTYKATYKPRAVKDDKHWERGYDKLVEFHKVNSHINGKWFTSVRSVASLERLTH